MAVLLTCDGFEPYSDGGRWDLVGVSFVHGRDFFAHVELDDNDLEGDMAELTLEAESLGNRRLLLATRALECGDTSAHVLHLPVLGMPSGVWRLSLRLDGEEIASREMSAGA